MVSFFAEVKIFRFWPKTMDYSQAFRPKSGALFAVLLLLAGRCYEAETCTILLPLRYSFAWYLFLPKSKSSDFGRKPWTIVRRFDRNRGHCLQSIYSSLEGAMKLKFSPFCSSCDALSHGILVCRSQNFQILAENRGLQSMVSIKFLATLITLHCKTHSLTHRHCVCVLLHSGSWPRHRKPRLSLSQRQRRLLSPPSRVPGGSLKAGWRSRSCRHRERRNLS